MDQQKQNQSSSQTQVFGPGNQPFMVEGDGVLAFALYFAFADFWDNGQPCVNYYTLDQLRSLGYRGLSPSDAAIKATDTGKKGMVTYIFKPLDKPEVIEWYKDQMLVIQNSEGLARDTVKNLMMDFVAGARSYEETIVRILTTVIYMRAEFSTMWQKFEPLIRLDSNEQATKEKMPDGSIVMSHPGFKFVGANASEETKKRLQLC